VSASPQPRWRGGYAAASAYPSGTACWYGRSRRAARPSGAGGRVGHLIATAGGREVHDADELHEVLDSLGEEGTLQLALVRGTDELTVIVAFGSGSEQVGSV
jgi:hypothetical protein